MAPDPLIAGDHMVIYATRYCLGRMTHAVRECADWLTAHWSRLGEHARTIVARDLEEAFARDDKARAAGRESGAPPPGGYPLGHDCDRAAWSRVRALYRTPRCLFCGRELTSEVPQRLHIDGERTCAECVPFECSRCGEEIEQLAAVIVDPVTRRVRHARACGGRP